MSMPRLLVALVMIQFCTPFTRESEEENHEPQSFLQINENTTVFDFCKAVNFPAENCSCEIFKRFCDSLPSRTKKDFTTQVPEIIIVCRTKHDIAQATIILFASFIAIVGNLCVLIVSARKWEKLTRCHKLICCLATADLCFGAMNVVITMPLTWTCQWWYPGQWTCKLFKSGLTMFVVLALGFIMIVALERYVGIVHPLYHGFTSTKIVFLILANVIIGIAMVTPTVLVLQQETKGICCEDWFSQNGSLIYSWANLLIQFVIPIVLLSMLYFKMMATLIKAQKGAGLTSSSHLKRTRNNRRIMRILMVILVSFIFLTFPNNLVWLLTGYIDTNDMSLNTYTGLRFFAFTPYAFHAAVNPFIYSFIDKRFRQRISKMIKSKKRMTSSLVLSTITRDSSVTVKENDPQTKD